MSLPPHWHEAEQLQARLRESRSTSRERRYEGFRALGMSESDAANRVNQQDAALETIEASYTPPGGGLVSMAEMPPLRTTDEEPSLPEPAPARPPEPQRGRRRMTKSEIREDMYARGKLVRPVDDNEGAVDRGPEPQRVEFDLPSTPGSTGRSLTGAYRLAVGTLAGAAVAVVAWIALQLLGVAAFSWTMWHPALMVAAGVLPLAGLSGWVLSLWRDVRFYIRVGGRAPATFSKW